MRKSLVAGALALVGVIAIATSSPLMAAGKEAAKARSMEKPMGHMEMSTYLVVSPHSQEECLATLDTVAMGGNEALAKWEWGCMSGDHTGYRMVKAASAEEALKAVPENVRSKAKAMKLSMFTAAEIKALHEHMKS